MESNRYFFRKSGAGFTLIELLVVIAIIGILAVIVLANMPAARQKARIAKAQTQIKDLYMAIAMLEGDTGQWPGHQRMGYTNCSVPGGPFDDNELCGDCDHAGVPADSYNLDSGPAGLIIDDASIPFSSWDGPYYKGPVPTVPADPWGNGYFFDTDYWTNGACRVVIGSYGPDGASDLVGNSNSAGANSEDDVIYMISAK